MELAIIPIDKTIIVDGEGIQISNVDISWIPTDVWAVHWNSTTSKGEIEYNDGKPNAEITEIGIYQQAVTDHASEKTAVANATEAARDHLQEVKNRRVSLLFESDFTGANIINANFEGANLNNAIWIDGKKCSLGSIGECKK